MRTGVHAISIAVHNLQKTAVAVAVEIRCLLVAMQLLSQPIAVDLRYRDTAKASGKQNLVTQAEDQRTSIQSVPKNRWSEHLGGRCPVKAQAYEPASRPAGLFPIVKTRVGFFHQS